MAMKKKAPAGKKSKAGNLKSGRSGGSRKSKKAAGVLRTLSKPRPPIGGGSPKNKPMSGESPQKKRPPIPGGPLEAP